MERKEAADDRHEQHAASHAPEYGENTDDKRNDEKDQRTNPPVRRAAVGRGRNGPGGDRGAARQATRRRPRSASRWNVRFAFICRSGFPFDSLRHNSRFFSRFPSSVKISPPTIGYPDASQRQLCCFASLTTQSTQTTQRRVRRDRRSRLPGVPPHPGFFMAQEGSHTQHATLTRSASEGNSFSCPRCASGWYGPVNNPDYVNRQERLPRRGRNAHRGKKSGLAVMEPPPERPTSPETVKKISISLDEAVSLSTE